MDMSGRLAAALLSLALLPTACAEAPAADAAQRSEAPAASRNIEEPAEARGSQTSDDGAGNNLNLYKGVLDLYDQALREHQAASGQWQPDKYYAEDGLVPSIVNPYWTEKGAEELLSREGFAFLDLNEDGVDELVIGWIGSEFWNMDDGFVFAVYTVVDGSVTLAIESWERCRYVIGEDGYLYQNGSGSSAETTYTKYKFNLEYEDFLEPIEEVYSCINADGGQRWERTTNPEYIGKTDAAGKHGEMEITQDAALDIGETWMRSGITIDCTPFSEYVLSE